MARDFLAQTVRINYSPLAVFSLDRTICKLLWIRRDIGIFVDLCLPVQCCVKLNALWDNAESKLISVCDIAEPGWSLSGTALSQAGYCPGQRWVKLISVRDSAETGWSLSGTALCQAYHCRLSVEVTNALSFIVSIVASRIQSVSKDDIKTFDSLLLQ